MTFPQKKITLLLVVFLFYLIWRTARFVEEKKKPNRQCTALKNLTIPSPSAFLTLESLTCREQPCQSCSKSNRADKGSQHIEQQVDANVLSTKRVTKENKAENGEKKSTTESSPSLFWVQNKSGKYLCGQMFHRQTIAHDRLIDPLSTVVVKRLHCGTFYHIHQVFIDGILLFDQWLTSNHALQKARYIVMRLPRVA